jgi:hypothetical protein
MNNAHPTDELEALRNRIAVLEKEKLELADKMERYRTAWRDYADALWKIDLE